MHLGARISVHNQLFRLVHVLGASRREEERQETTLKRFDRFIGNSGDLHSKGIRHRRLHGWVIEHVDEGRGYVCRIDVHKIAIFGAEHELGLSTH